MELKANRTDRILLVAVAIGVWVLVAQNLGLLPSPGPAAIPVEVVNRVGVSGSVDVSGSVSVDNTVDINIEEINGHDDVFFNDGFGTTKYYRLPISN